MKNKKNLSIVIDAYTKGGAQKVLSLLIPEFLEIYKSVSIFLIQDSSNELNLEDLQSKGLKVFRINAKKITDINGLSRFVRALIKSNPDYIHCHLYWSQIWTGFLKFIFPKPRIFWIEHNTYLSRNKFQWLIFKYFAKYVDKIVVVSHEVKTFLQGIKVENLVVIFNPISISFEPRWKKNSNPLYIFVGRLNYQKNPSLALNAFAFALSNRLIPKTSKMILCGEGPLLDALIKESKELKIDESVVFKGYLAEIDLSEVYKSAMVLVSTSRFEGFSLVRAEAMASGCTIVTTRTSGIIEILTENMTEKSVYEGVFIVENSLKSIAQGMASAIDPIYWTPDSIRFRNRITDKLGVKIIAEKYSDLLFIFELE